MKKLCISFISFAIIVLIGFSAVYSKSQTKSEYLRIHIRADSNLEVDQAVKYKVKDSVVEFLTPIIAECKTKVMAEKMLTENLGNIQKVADKTLIDNGFKYKSRAKINNEYFPTREYGDLVLFDGYYDALILELGSGSGDNWWCVVYPPLCFTGTGVDYIYKSKIKEIIDNFYKVKERK